MANGSDQAGLGIASQDCGIVQFDGWHDARARFEADLAPRLGGHLPKKVGETTYQHSKLVVRIAPRRFWLISDGLLPPIDIDPELGCMLQLGEGRVRLGLSGWKIKHVLERCVVVDWDSLQEGEGVLVGFHHVPVLLLRTGSFQCDLFVPRSFARSLVDWISDVSSGVR
ncbi:sarcosine oxidase subunit gamma [Mesorhizobium sp. YC-39]|uniref:sarcosine oxidase subunit gamma n=1 Tax=unclassified Mesorhizobium TaxID=325217 RepID=UPI0021E99243|nr:MULTISPECIES: sarcosine oxidase subunit gamma [unclassified Mesorhizobium]MCV3211488.1 sarcosine oxidase subunit gamma [Mesorhizobium sp. YC-2]MCV3233156.1 sarcosine oxidase subunit gamma [Mesorhizobium sp. YC-39]